MGRRKIEIKYIADDRNRSVTFIKRKNGLFKKAHELSILTGAKVTVHVEDLKERHFDYKSANLGGQVAADFDSDEEDDDDLTDDVAGGQQMDEDHQQQKQHQQQVQVQQQQLHQQQQQQQQGRPPPQASQVRPLQIIAAQPARPGHRRTQSSNVSPNASSSKIRPTGHPYPRSPKVPSTPTMTSTSHRPVSLDLNWYGQMNGAPTGIVTPASATPQGAAAAHAHRLSSASTISNMDLAQAMQGSPRMNVQTGGQQFRADQTYYQEPGLAELQEMFAHEAQQQQALPNGQFMQGFLPSQSHGRGVKLEDFEGFEIMEEDAEASMTQASTPALYDYSANPSLTNLHAIPNGMSNAPGLGIVLEAGSDGFNGASSIDQQFQTVSAQQAQQHQLMQQQAHMQGRPMHSAHMQQSYQQFRRSPGYDPSHPHNPQTSFYSNASGAMSTPNLSCFGNSR